MNFFFPVLLLILSDTISAKEPICHPWEIPVKAHKVKKYKKKDGITVRTTNRKAHCREKWRLANVNPAKLKNKSKLLKPKYKLRKWTEEDKLTILENLSTVPDSLSSLPVNTIIRVKSAGHKDNPASSEIKQNTIVIADPYFKSFQKSEILIHELAHFEFMKLTNQEIGEFLSLSGWTLEEPSLIARKATIIPPKKLILADSDNSIEEDFANCLEVYFSNPQKLKSFNKQLYLYFKKRYKK